MPNQYNPKYAVNHNYFSNPTIENCYWAGFIAADGCIAIDYIRLTICLHPQDRNLLETFKQHISFTGPIHERIQRKIFPFVRLKVHSKQIIADLNKNFNITNKKSLTLRAPNLVLKDHILAYIRGYIDGDGSMGIYRRDHKKNTFKAKLSLVSTAEVINFIKDNLNKYISEKITTVPHNYQKYSKGCYEWAIHGHKVKDIVELLMSVPGPRLKRKWDKFLTDYQKVYKNNKYAKINNKPLTVVSFQKKWQKLKRGMTKKDLGLFYKTIDIDGTIGRVISFDRNGDDHPDFFRHWFPLCRCHWNVIFPLWLLNGRKLTGRYDIITSDKHSAIINNETNEIYDPTYMASKTSKKTTLEYLGDTPQKINIIEHVSVVDQNLFERFLKFIPKRQSREAINMLESFMEKIKTKQINYDAL